MKYILYSIWLIATAIMCLTIAPGVAAYYFTTWFEIGDKILKS